MRIAALAAALVACAGLLVPATAAAEDTCGGRPPVVLLHGLGGNGPGNFLFLQPYLEHAGFCAFTFTYGQPLPAVPVGGLTAIQDSSRQIAAFIDRVRRETHSARVDLVGHSEGAFQALYVPKVLGYADRVRRVVALAPPTHGTDVSRLVTLADRLGVRSTLDRLLTTVGCAACPQLLPGGSAVETLTAGPIAQDGVRYTIIASRTDLDVTPHETSFVPEPGVRNVFVQDVCPHDPVGHVGLAFDGGVADMIDNALDPRHAPPVRCTIGPPA